MTKIRYMSDLHIEFDSRPYSKFKISEHDDDENTVLVLAGDIGLAKKLDTLRSVLDQTTRFKKVVYINGNHEYYNSSIYSTHTKISDLIEDEYDPKHISYMENNFTVVDDVAFIAATMWSDFNNRNPIVMNEAQGGMNDFNCIRNGPAAEPWKRKFTPIDAVQKHDDSVKYIFDAIKFHRTEGRKVVVVTHHAPSYQSIEKKYVMNGLNGAYSTNLEDQILATEPNVWIHGHVHASFDYMVGKTNVLTNPRGYSGYELNRLFDIDKSVTI